MTVGKKVVVGWKVTVGAKVVVGAVVGLGPVIWTLEAVAPGTMFGSLVSTSSRSSTATLALHVSVC